MAPEILNDVFQLRTSSYNLRTNSNFYSRPVHFVYNGTESFSFLGPKIWELVPEDIKKSGSLEVFKRKIKKCVPSNVLADYAVFTYKILVSYTVS